MVWAIYGLYTADVFVLSARRDFQWSVGRKEEGCRKEGGKVQGWGYCIPINLSVVGEDF